jgi:Rrf2 family transcriptional regulator, cysteine metabolism repressor
MRLNTKVRYAIRMMADIAKHGGGQPVALKDVAERQDLPKHYLSQLTAPLKNASLLKSVWGNNGGYVLGRSASEISLLEIFQAVDGPIKIIDCVLDPGSCDRAEFCECVGVWRGVNDAIVQALEKYTLAHLVGRRRPALDSPAPGWREARGARK